MEAYSIFTNGNYGMHAYRFFPTRLGHNVWYMYLDYHTDIVYLFALEIISR